MQIFVDADACPVVDIVESIAEKYNTTWQKIYDDNKGIIGNNPNLIFKGQKLIIK